MPRNLFEAMDKRASAAVGRLLEEPCIWHPMRVKPSGTYTMGQSVEIDPDRPKVLDLRAIVTWKDTTGDESPGAGGNQVASGALIVDLDESQFPDLKPVKGDRLGLPAQDRGERMVEITRRMDDGSSRLLYVCKVA